MNPFLLIERAGSMWTVRRADDATRPFRATLIIQFFVQNGAVYKDERCSAHPMLFSTKTEAGEWVESGRMGDVIFAADESAACAALRRAVDESAKLDSGA